MSAFILLDRVRETTETSGDTSVIELAGAVAKFQSFAETDLVDYCIVPCDSNAWIVCRGIYAAGPPRTLTRSEILDSSNNGLDITLSGTADVFGVSSARFQTRNIVSTKTSDYTILANESSTRFNNSGAGASVTLTLPAAAIGLRYGFMVATAQALNIVRDGTDQLASAGDTGTTLSSSAPFSLIELECQIVGTWTVASHVGDWTVS